MTNNEKIEREYFPQLICAAIHREKAPPPPPELDASALFRLAERHRLAALLAEPLRSVAAFPAPILARFEQSSRRALFDEARRMTQCENLSRRFEEEKILWLPMKGSIVKAFYPEPQWRTMNDVDWLIFPPDSERAEKILLNEGFTLQSRQVHHDNYFKAPSFLLELHHTLLDPWSDVYSDRMKERFAPERLRDRLLRRAGTDFCAEMTPVDFYLYFFLHLIHHLHTGGFGVRFVLDHYLLTLRYKKNGALAEETLDALREEKLDGFFQTLDSLARFWFGHSGEPVSPEAVELGEFVLDSGLFGRFEQAVAGRLRSMPEGGFGPFKKLMYLAGRAFPPFKKTARYYPALRRFPPLLPLYWVRLNFERIFSRRNSFLGLARGVFFAKTDEADRFEAFLVRVGLPPRHSKG